MKPINTNNAFKTCTTCAHRWHALFDLIRDKDLQVNGYQASFNNTEEGLFFLTHNVEGCGTTIAIRAGELRDLYDGLEHTLHLAYTEDCNERCMDGEDLEPCLNECDMRWVREILQILKNHGPEELLQKLERSRNTEAA